MVNYNMIGTHIASPLKKPDLLDATLLRRTQHVASISTTLSFIIFLYLLMCVHGAPFTLSEQISGLGSLLPSSRTLTNLVTVIWPWVGPIILRKTWWG